MPEHEEWRGSTGGSTWMHKGLMWIFRLIGVRPMYAVMGIFVAPSYMLFNHKAYLSIYHYFRRRHKYSVWKSFWYTYLNHYRFGQIILDRFANYSGRKFDFELIGNDRLMELMDRPEGFVIVSSHVGNYEIAGYTFASEKKKYNALVFGGEAKTVMENRNRLLSGNNIRMIPVRDDMSHIFEMNNALADGDIVSIPGDRIFGSPKYATCDFMNGKARFPIGPMTLAVQRDSKVIAIFVMKEATYKYKVYIRELNTSEEGINRKERAMRVTQAFASEMESVLKEYPEQWFNYYEFWDGAGE